MIWLGASSPASAAAKAAHAAKRVPESSVEPAGVEADAPAPAPEPLAPVSVAQVATWVQASRDNGSLPYVIVDKVAAKVFLFEPDGHLTGMAPALVGSARGDQSTPGVGDRELSSILPKDRTTPAGRFIASFGPGPGGKRILWVDYSTAISLHAVIVANPKEHRLHRLKTPTPKDNRITFGCINVPTAFYRDVVAPAFRHTSGIVYILPEMAPPREVLTFFQAQSGGASAPPAEARQDGPETDLRKVGNS